jgi:ADP-L-glycero-D-manno-heptose 6-epimerase
MKALVTGGAGFIGSNIAMELDKEHEVTVLDNFSNGSEKNLEGFTGKIIKDSIVDFDWQKLDVDVVFHEAAISDTRVMDEDLMMQTNVEAFRKMLEWASQNNVKVIYASSAAVYGNSPAPHRVSQPLTPLNIYGKSKVEMDKVATEYFDKMHVIGLR